MAHKTRVNGTNYEISGGKTLIGGTAYSIDKGKTLVDGTAYEVGFAPALATVMLKNHGGGFAYFVIDGVTVEYGYTEIEVSIGTVVECYVYRSEYYAPNPSVNINGERVWEYENEPYRYTVTCDVVMESGEERDSSRRSYGVIEINEVLDGYVLLKVLGYAGYVSVDGTYYYDGDYIVVPVGTIVTLDNFSYAAEEKESYIDVNDTRVLEGCGSYDYTATTNATIEMTSVDAGDGLYYHRINVTEE